MNLLFFLLILLSFFTIYTSGFFRSRTKSENSKNCCILPKMYVDSTKANLGKDFFRQLTIKSDLYEEINPENICNLMHFLFQQTSINNKSRIFTEGMFIIFDSSNQIFDRLIKSQQNSDSFNFRDYLPPMNPHSNTLKQTSDRYPTYEIDIPKSCLLSNFDHIIFGELPPFLNDDKYNGRRIFIKPDRFGLFSGLNNINLFIKKLVKQEFCRLIKGETKSECEKLRAFKENTDKILLEKWINILLNIPLKWIINKQYKERAIKYGIREIDQQSKDLEALGAGKYVKKFRKLLIEKYGQDDIRVRKGQEIIFTITQLKQTYLTCQSSNDIKCRF